MNYEALNFWWMVAVTVANVGLFIFTYFSTRDKGNDERLSKIENRLIKIETDIEHMPSVSEISQLRGDIEGLRAQIIGMSTSLSGMTRQLELINQYLLNQ